MHFFFFLSYTNKITVLRAFIRSFLKHWTLPGLLLQKLCHLNNGSLCWVFFLLYFPPCLPVTPRGHTRTSLYNINKIQGLENCFRGSSKWARYWVVSCWGEILCLLLRLFSLWWWIWLGEWSQFSKCKVCWWHSLFDEMLHGNCHFSSVPFILHSEHSRQNL